MQPDLTGASVLNPLFRRYSSIPSVKALADGLAKMAARPPQVAERLTYTQTIPSSQRAANRANDNAAKMNLLEVRLPLALAVLGLILLGLGLFGLRRSRKGRASAGGPDADAAITLSEVDAPAPSEPVRTHEGV